MKPNTEKLLAEADVVFEGEAQTSGDDPRISYWGVTDFKVLRAWKGISHDEVAIRTELYGPPCSSIRFRPGTRYIVFAFKKGDAKLFTSAGESFSADAAWGDEVRQFMMATHEPVADRAAALAVRGETVQARRLLASSSDSGSPGALFVLVCIELEEGHVEAASHALARLQSLRPHTPEVLVLTKLVEERGRSPQAGWTDALVRAWNAAGRPQPTDAALLAASARQAPVSGEALAAVHDTPDAFLLAFAQSEAEPSRLLDSALSVASAAQEPYAAQLVALAVLSSDKVGDAKRRTAQSAARQLLAQLAAAHPDNGYLATGVVVGVPPVTADPLSASQVAGLEDAVKRPAFDLPIRPLFVAFRDAYQRADAGQAAPTAFSETVGALPLDIHVALSRRVEATVAPERRSRAVAVLEAAGARLGAGRSILERMIGVSLQTKAAQLRDDARGIEVASKTRKQLQNLLAAMSALTDYGWPIASFWRDWLDRCSVDEVAVATAISQ